MAWAEDMSVFFDDLDSVAATFPGGDVQGYLDDEYVEALGVAGVKPVFTCATVDVTSVTEGDAVTIGGVSYEVVIPQSDGTGLTKVVLKDLS